MTDVVRSPVPRRAGTFEREASSSFHLRWAEKLNVPISALLKHFVRPEMYPSDSSKNWVFWPVLDGGGADVGLWVQAAEKLTGRAEFTDLTLRGMTGLMCTRLTLRQSYSWCPWCLDEFSNEQAGGEEGADQAAYSPLIWRVPQYTVCIIHELGMLQRCPHCGCDSIQIIFSNGRVGCCSRCRKWLGTPGSGSYSEADRQSLLESVCVAEVFELPYVEPVAKANSINFFADILKLNPDWRDGLACLLSLSPRSVRRRREGVAKPSLRDLIRLAIAARMGVAELVARRPFPESLSEVLVSGALHGTEQIGDMGRREKTRRRLRETVKEASDAGLLMSPHSLGRSLRANPSTLLNLDPDLMREVAQRYKEILDKRITFKQRLEAIMDEIILSGKFPSCERIKVEGKLTIMGPNQKRIFGELRNQRGLPLGIGRTSASQAALEEEIARLARKLRTK